MRLSVDDIQQRTNMLITKNDEYLNIETAIEPFEPQQTITAPHPQPQQSITKSKFKHEKSKRDHLKMASVNLKIIRPQDLGTDLKVIDLSYNRIRELPD
jgi:hypothetical protein